MATAVETPPPTMSTKGARTAQGLTDYDYTLQHQPTLVVVVPTHIGTTIVEGDSQSFQLLADTREQHHMKHASDQISPQVAA